MARITTFLFLVFSSALWAVSPEQRVAELNIELKDKGKPTANFVYAVVADNLVFTAGHVSVGQDGKPIKGKLGKTLTTEQGAAAARAAGISLLSTLKQELGSLDRVERIVKVLGMVNAAPDFTEHSQVMNGFSDLMVEVFGQQGKHARSAVGMGSLPGNYAVEIEMIVKLRPVSE